MTRATAGQCSQSPGMKSSWRLVDARPDDEESDTANAYMLPRSMRSDTAAHATPGVEGLPVSSETCLESVTQPRLASSCAVRAELQCEASY